MLLKYNKQAAIDTNKAFRSSPPIFNAIQMRPRP